MKTSQQKFSVTEINNILKNLVEPKFKNIAVEGEISNFKVSYTGHAYFTLKDSFSEISCVLFKSNFQKIKFSLKNGIKIIILGNITVYSPRGTFQINVSNIMPVGLGLLQMQFEELKQKLFELGWFNNETKKTIPRYPERIGIITSPKAAALQDVFNVIKRRYPKVTIYIYPVSVQGESSKFQIVEAFNFFYMNPIVDLILLVRGGGSIEDLWSFNEKIVAEAIYKCPIPVVTGIGHEIDFTISDFVSDKRAPTPSAAAEIAVPDVNEIYKFLINIHDLLNKDLFNKLTKFKEKIEDVEERLILNNPFNKIETYHLKIDELYNRIHNALNGKINFYKQFVKSIQLRSSFEFKILSLKNLLNSYSEKFRDYYEKIILNYKNQLDKHGSEMNNIITKKFINKFHKLKMLETSLSHLNPYGILERGYSVVYKNNAIIRDETEVEVNDEIKIKLSKGYLHSKIIKKKIDK